MPSHAHPPVPNARIPDRWSLAGWLLAACVPIARESHWFLSRGRGAEHVLACGFADDAYYYLQIARNLARGAGSTFDGTIHTNGYHPLWLGLLSALARVDASDEGLVGLAILASAAVWCAALAGAYRVSVALGSPRFALLALPWLAWFGATWAGTGSDLFFNGMESGLTVALLLHAAATFVRGGPGAELRTGFWLAATLLARLDAVFVIAGVFGIEVLRGLRSPAPVLSVLRRGARLAGPAAVAGVTLAAANLAAFGHVATTSARAKTLGGPYWSTDAVVTALRYGFWKPLPFLAGLAVLALAGGLVARGDGTDEAPGRARLWLAGSLVAWSLQVFVLYRSTSWFVWGWYFYLVTPTAVVTGALLSRSLAARTTSRAGGAVVLALAACSLLLVGWVNRPRPAWRTGEAFLAESAEVVASLRRSDPEVGGGAARVAMGDRAGSFGYFLDGGVFQLEGLVNDHAYLDDLSRGVVDRAYLRARGVRYFVGSGGEPSDVDPRTGCGTYVEPRFGRGPKARIRVCARETVIERTGGPDGPYRVWRIDGTGSTP